MSRFFNFVFSPSFCVQQAIGWFLNGEEIVGGGESKSKKRSREGAGRTPRRMGTCTGENILN